MTVSRGAASDRTSLLERYYLQVLTDDKNKLAEVASSLDFMNAKLKQHLKQAEAERAVVPPASRANRSVPSFLFLPAFVPKPVAIELQPIALKRCDASAGTNLSQQSFFAPPKPKKVKKTFSDDYPFWPKDRANGARAFAQWDAEKEVRVERREDQPMASVIILSKEDLKKKLLREQSGKLTQQMQTLKLL